MQRLPGGVRITCRGGVGIFLHSCGDGVDSVVDVTQFGRPRD